MLVNDYPWEGGFAQLIQTQSTSGQEAQAKLKEPDNWGKFLLFNWI